MKKLIFLFFIFCANAYSQSYFKLDDFQIKPFETVINRYDSTINFHTSVRPFLDNDFIKISNYDSLSSVLKNKNTKTWIGRKVFNENLITFTKNKFYFDFNIPLFTSRYYDDINQKQNAYENGVGGEFNFRYSNKLFFNYNYTLSYSKFPFYIQEKIPNNRVIPGQGFAKLDYLYSFMGYKGYYYNTNSFYLSYNAYKYFNLQAGYGKNFFGDGYRSMFLSNNAYNYPYFKITTTIWKIKMVNLFTEMSDFTMTGKNTFALRTKYGAFHYLSWNATRRLNISFFEALISYGKEDTTKKGFELSHLNPVVFYRPVDFGNGNPANTFMGFAFKYKVAKKNVVYFQFLIDDMIVKDIRNDIKHIYSSDSTLLWGHWMAKQSGQLGIKSFDIFRIKNLFFQTEFNATRPFTYSHRYVLQNYSNSNQPLADPFGANFYESVSFLKYNYKKLFLELEFLYSKVGYDSPGTNYGQDMYQLCFDSRIAGTNNIPVAKQWGNFIGQGVTTNMYYTNFKVSYVINFKTNLRLEAGITNINTQSKLKNDNQKYFYIGIRTSLDNCYFDY